MAAMVARSSALLSWLRRTDWLWMIIAGFYQIAYLFWYIPAFAELPASVREPPDAFPWHWPLDVVVTGVSGAVLLVLGFHRATELTSDRSPERARTGSIRDVF